MTYDDSVLIAAKSPAQPPTLARMSRGGKASGLETLGNVVVSGRRRTPLVRKPTSASRPRGKFSALQSVENAQNAERISILREPVPIGGGNGLAPTGKARRRASGLLAPRVIAPSDSPNSAPLGGPPELLLENLESLA